MKFISPKFFPRAIALILLITVLTGISPTLSHPVRAAAFTSLDLIANIETVGVVVVGASQPQAVQLFYRQQNENTWRTGHPLTRIDDGRLVGSLFGLSPATTYDVRVFDGTSELIGSVTTQPDTLQFNPVNFVYVDDNAPAGGNGSASAPFQKIQDGINLASPGTQVLVADGTYRENITFPTSGTPGNWIQVKAMGSAVILDGSETFSGSIWTPHPSKAKVWYIKFNSAITYLGRDSKRYYKYDNLNGLLEGAGHNNVPMNEGWFLDTTTQRLYVRSLDDPSQHNWQIPRLNHAINVDDRDWIWIEGFEIRFYGANYNGCGICTTNASHLVIRGNKIHNINLGIYFNWTGGEDRGNDTRVENNEIYDPPVNEWPWAAVKGTSMEGTAIVVRGHIGAIVRNNDLHNFFNGIYTGTSGDKDNPGVAFDADIYNNRIYNISDDALEPEGACVNHRFRNNTVDRTLIGVSIAPVTQGPLWVMRSTFTNFTGSSIKWDLNSDGAVFIYNNTFWTNAPNLNAMSMIRPVFNSVMYNNIFQGNGFAFEEPFTGMHGHKWNYNNWYTTRGASGPHFKWENVTYNNIATLCSATGLECNGHENVPGLTNPAGGDLSLTSSSPNIDRGAFIQGINDNFIGSAPDIGAYESGYGAPTPATVTPPPTITPAPQGNLPSIISISRLDSNPSTASLIRFAVNFSTQVTGVDTSDFTLFASGVTNATVNEVAGAGNAYTVTVNTGTGDGTLRLDLSDDDSIKDAGQLSLGGSGTGNGSFTNGEIYTITKTAPAVTEILFADPNPSQADSVRFTVNFSESVSGVDASDFVVIITGAINGVGIASVAGAGNTYTVTVNTGTGNGMIRLTLADNDSIVNASSTPLGGIGLGNGSFNNGAEYTINKPTIVKIVNIFTSNGGNDGWILETKKNSGVGGTKNSGAQTLNVGDDNQDRQYRVILDFQTDSLPDNAVITMAILMIKKQGRVGTDPFHTHGNIMIDLQSGAFGANGLQPGDFQTPSSRDGAGTILDNSVNSWYWSNLDVSALPFINRTGSSQIRLRFRIPNNGEGGNDLLQFYSGNAKAADRPQLRIEYYVP